ncbi:hypothetical protein U0070_020647, partial [Myodes glareolus]
KRDGSHCCTGVTCRTGAKKQRLRLDLSRGRRNFKMRLLHSRCSPRETLPLLTIFFQMKPVSWALALHFTWPYAKDLDTKILALNLLKVLPITQMKRLALPVATVLACSVAKEEVEKISKDKDIGNIISNVGRKGVITGKYKKNLNYELETIKE